MKIDPTHQHLAAFDPHELLVFAARYCIGRKTIAAAAFARDLAKAWPAVPAETRSIIRRDLEREFERDDIARQGDLQLYHLPLGMDCDRQVWELVRQAWLREEQA